LSSAINWPDAYTSYFATGIPNCEVYAETSVIRQLTYQIGASVPASLKALPLDSVVRQTDPPAAALSIRQTVVATVEDPWRQTAALRLSTINAYVFTQIVAVAIAKKTLQGSYRPGFQTPSSAYGSRLLRKMPETTIEPIDSAGGGSLT
jgi:short subunit dehydrogenase-like uncharacterized protein